MKKQERIPLFVAAIWEWFGCHKRELPWRDLHRESEQQRSYMVWVSEVMLQQTQVSRVIPIYKRFLEQFPTVEHLAAAGNGEVLRAWQGMGYNSRAIRLRDAAGDVCRHRDGVFPHEMTDLLSIKGIGEYTAAAIRNFAFCIPTPCIDTNIRRILHRTFVGPENPDGSWRKDDRYLYALADDVLHEAMRHPVYTTADWHAALMDFGSLVCTKRSPKWDRCPLTARGLCKAAYKVRLQPSVNRKKQEPGREMAGKFVPNRIFRGRVIDELRQERDGLPLDDIGRRICIDWSPREHASWLHGILQGLERDQLLQRRRETYALVD